MRPDSVKACRTSSESTNASQYSPSTILELIVTACPMRALLGPNWLAGQLLARLFSAPVSGMSEKDTHGGYPAFFEAS
jgi:hypothetical protein